MNVGSISDDPAGKTLITVVPKASEYPEPGSTILTSVTDPFSKTGTNTAPTPSPSTSKSGVEIYLLPDFELLHQLFFLLRQLETNWQSDPDWSSTVGCLSKFKTSEIHNQHHHSLNVKKLLFPLRLVGKTFEGLCSYGRNSTLPDKVSEISG